MKPLARFLARVKPRRLATWSGLALALVLLSGLFNQPAQFRLLVRPVFPLLRFWNQPDAQYRILLGDVPYDLLRDADAALPRDASVLLVTRGRDVRRLEYTFFHRALYFLAPRSVWWLAPAPADGTWESRWWISAPLTASAVQAVARQRQATHILVFQPPGAPALDPVSYTHLTPPTSDLVEISVVAVLLKKKNTQCSIVQRAHTEK